MGMTLICCCASATAKTEKRKAAFRRSLFRIVQWHPPFEEFVHPLVVVVVLLVTLFLMRQREFAVKLDVVGRTTDKNVELTCIRTPVAFFDIVERESPATERDSHVPGLAWFQIYFCEPLQLLDWPRNGWTRFANVELRHFGCLTLTRVLQIEGNNYRLVQISRLRRYRQAAVCKSFVGKTVTEGKQRLPFRTIEVPVYH